MHPQAAADRVGLGWRGELAGAIFERIDAIDVLEVVAEDWLHASGDKCAALAELARVRPMLLHGVSLGLASCDRVEARRVEAMARLIERTGPQAWSEHLAFVRAGGVEIGHLAAPPRSVANIEGALANLRRINNMVGRLPCLENVATLIDPPGSTMDEPHWVRSIVEASGAPMLLDLHNLYANALNFGRPPLELLLAMPLERVSMVHLSGGRWIGREGRRPRLLDDHQHDVPQDVYTLLERLASEAGQPLTVIIERDGNYPGFEALLAQMEQARLAMARGREHCRRAACAVP
jgi:uncharacterized protein (UPF0276 family)